jgi:NTP pyrophosphatase (non-canonical NTP hydrolase)
MFLKQLREANLRRVGDFHAGSLWDWSPAERGNELAGETGELCNELKKLLRHVKRCELAGKSHSLGPERDEILGRVKNELGDVIICADLIAAQLYIDVEMAVRGKFNATSRKIGSMVVL